MTIKLSELMNLIISGFLIVNLSSCTQNEKAGDSGGRKYKMTTPIPPGIECPNSVESRLGTLKFFDGFPDDATVEKLYDNLDFQRAVQAYLLGLPAVNIASYREGITREGSANNTIFTFENLMDSRTLFLTANCNTPYTWMWLDLHNGPLVQEVPPKVLGIYNDGWGRYMEDVGFLGPDKGQGGRYLLLPPGYEGEVPSGYFVIKSSTYGCVFVYRHFAVNGDYKPALENLKKNARVYPLTMSDNPPPNIFMNVSGREMCMIAPSGYRFWEILNSVVQEEPSNASDKVSLGYFASVGIEKGKEFASDARMKKILTEAAVVGDATARAINYKMRQKENILYDNSSWRPIFIAGYNCESQPNVLNLDAYISVYFPGIGVSPAEEIKIIGKASQYAWVSTDSKGNMMNGGKNYRLHLPAGIPAKDFWSVILYDTQTRSLLQTDQQYPMASSQNKNMIINPDKSVDVFFGPEAPKGNETNWIQTIPGKSWFALLRIYGPLESWFDKTWRPGEIELIK